MGFEVVLSHEDEKIFEDLYLAIIEEKSNCFNSWKENLNDRLIKEVGSMGLRDDMLFYEEELIRTNEEFEEDRCAGIYKGGKFSRAIFEEEFWYEERVEAMRQTYDHIVMKKQFISTYAYYYLYPHKKEFLEDSIASLKRQLFPQESHAKIFSASTISLTKKIKPLTPKKQINQITALQWLNEGADAGGKKREKRLRYLYDFLQKHHFIERIAFSTFKKHFSGVTQNKFINWTKNQYYLIYLLNCLKPYMLPKLYKKNPSTTTIAKHFYFNNNPIKIKSLNVIAHNAEVYSNKEIENKINLAINVLAVI